MATFHDKTHSTDIAWVNRIRSATLESSVHWFLKRLGLTKTSLKKATVFNPSDPGRSILDSKARAETSWTLASDGSWIEHRYEEPVMLIPEAGSILSWIGPSDVDTTPEKSTVTPSMGNHREHFVRDASMSSIYNAASFFGGSLRKTGLFTAEGTLPNVLPRKSTVEGELAEQHKFKKARHPSIFEEINRGDTPAKRPLPVLRPDGKYKPLPSIDAAKERKMAAAKKNQPTVATRPLPTLPGTKPTVATRPLPTLPGRDTTTSRRSTVLLKRSVPVPGR